MKWDRHGPIFTFVSIACQPHSACARLLAWPVAGQSPPAEQRIALVVGDGAYANAPLATAANDAGLIAQTLQAAGFDVVGARDLDGDALRKSFRDFMQKAESSGPGTVAMVYLSGYALQYSGENYFIPVDSSIGRDTDIPIEGLRLSDYMRQLGTLPLKAGIMVIDAARQQPFVRSQIASGLSLVEPAQHMLIAYNAAPGTVAPGEQGPYGAYAQALAEMIRTGGLPLPEVFNRVRLRVSETSKGGQIPWDAEKLDAEFNFFDRAPDAPPQAPPDQVAALRSRPIRDLGAQDAFGAALERDTLQSYEDFLVAYPNDPLARRVRAIVAARREAITWRRTYRADTPEAYWSYLRRYPRGPHTEDARRRLTILTAALRAATAICHDRLRYPAAAAGGDHLCRSSRSGVQRSRVRLRAAPAASGVLPATAAARFRRAGSAAPAGWPVHPAAAAVHSDSGLCADPGECRAAAEQHYLQEHS